MLWVRPFSQESPTLGNVDGLTLGDVCNDQIIALGSVALVLLDHAKRHGTCILSTKMRHAELRHLDAVNGASGGAVHSASSRGVCMQMHQIGNDMASECNGLYAARPSRQPVI